MEQVFDVIIVGAGIAGCAAFSTVARAGLKVCLLEKSRGIGGRSAVRRGDGWNADLGAQFCNATSTAWKDFFKSASEQIVTVDVELFDKNTLNTNRVKRFVHKNGMNAFAKKLLHEFDSQDPATDLDSTRLCLQTRVTKLCFDNSDLHAPYWNIQAISDAQPSPKQIQFKAKIVLLTAPLPQTLEVFDRSALQLAESSKEPLQNLQYTSCVAAIYERCDLADLGTPAIWKSPGKNLSGIFDQRAKGLTTEKGVWVVHADAGFSEQLWGLSDSEITSKMKEATLAALTQATGRPSDSKHWKSLAVHKWRYCEPKTVLQEPYHQVQFENFLHQYSATNPLLLAGDAFIRSSIEGAFCSGNAAGLHAIQLLKSQGIA